jgi:hypothetical protein
MSGHDWFVEIEDRAPVHEQIRSVVNMIIHTTYNEGKSYVLDYNYIRDRLRRLPRKKFEDLCELSGFADCLAVEDAEVQSERSWYIDRCLSLLFE